jgi:hypothetical protein
MSGCWKTSDLPTEAGEPAAVSNSALEGRRSRHPYLPASQSGVRGAEVEVRVLCLAYR